MLGFLKSLLRRRPGLALEFAALSERGLVRPENQDHFFAEPGAGVFCVADGMGGGEGGAMASDIAAGRVRSAARGSCGFPERLKGIGEAIHAANDDIRAFAAKAGYRQMATTVTVLALDVEAGGTGVIGYVGDSRVYRLRDRRLFQLTHDHTLAGELSRSRFASRAFGGRLEQRAGMLSHVLTRAVGIEPDVQTEWRKIDVRPGDIYLVCTDGVYDMLDEETMTAAFEPGAPLDETVQRLSRAIVAAGAQDNYTIVAVKIGGAK